MYTYIRTSICKNVLIVLLKFALKSSYILYIYIRIKYYKLYTTCNSIQNEFTIEHSIINNIVINNLQYDI